MYKPARIQTNKQTKNLKILRVPNYVREKRELKADVEEIQPEVGHCII